MKLTVALGLQYDNQAGYTPVHLIDSRQKPQLLPVNETVIDILPEAEVYRRVEYSSRHELFYLTYNLRGLPNPILGGQAKVNVYV